MGLRRSELWEVPMGKVFRPDGMRALMGAPEVLTVYGVSRKRIEAVG